MLFYKPFLWKSIEFTTFTLDYTKTLTNINSLNNSHLKALQKFIRFIYFSSKIYLITQLFIFLCYFHFLP